MRRALEAGASMQDVAEAEGISKQRVAQIVNADGWVSPRMAVLRAQRIAEFRAALERPEVLTWADLGALLSPGVKYSGESAEAKAYRLGIRGEVSAVLADRKRRDQERQLLVRVRTWMTANDGRLPSITECNDPTNGLPHYQTIHERFGGLKGLAERLMADLTPARRAEGEATDGPR